MKKYTYNLNTKNFGRIAYMIEFYEKVGVPWRNNNVQNFLMHPKDKQLIKYILSRTNVNYRSEIENTWDGLKVKLFRGSWYLPKKAQAMAAFDWFNYSPVDNPNVPRGEIWVLENGDEGWVGPVLR